MATFFNRISTMKSWPTLVVFSSNLQCLISTGSPVYNKNERRKPTFQCVYDWNLGFSSERIIRGESSVRVSVCANPQSRGSCVHNLHIKWRSDCTIKRGRWRGCMCGLNWDREEIKEAMPSLVFGVKKKKKVHGLEISAQQEEQHFVKKSWKLIKC